MYERCDLLKIHYLCGNKDNSDWAQGQRATVVICSKFITFAVTKTTRLRAFKISCRCDLLKIHYLCGNKDNYPYIFCSKRKVVICSKFITFAVTKTTTPIVIRWPESCDLLKIHYLCGNKDNM